MVRKKKGELYICSRKSFSNQSHSTRPKGFYRIEPAGNKMNGVKKERPGFILLGATGELADLYGL
mgnify:CR=1 FL=1